MTNYPVPRNQKTQEEKDFKIKQLAQGYFGSENIEQITSFPSLTLIKDPKTLENCVLITSDIKGEKDKIVIRNKEWKEKARAFSKFYKTIIGDYIIEPDYKTTS